ncbi:hypothetical protein BGZ81_004743, partial [Podila clonocystis]
MELLHKYKAVRVELALKASDRTRTSMSPILLLWKSKMVTVVLVLRAPRQDAQTQSETSSGYSPNGSASSHESFMSSLTEESDDHRHHNESVHMLFFMSAQTDSQQVLQQQQNNPGCHKDVQKVNTILFDGQVM